MALAQKLQRLSRLFFAVSPNYTCKVNQLSFARAASTTQPLFEKKEVSITFVKANGERITTKGKVGDSILDIVVNNEIDLDGYGACEGTLTCSTCHLIFPKNVYDNLPSKPTDEETDMLDLAFELTDTSRLGCQIIMSEELDGIEVRVPSTINDVRAS
ncbi:adrenodoxin-like protein 2, mitochondrial isoform X2 [Linepithema humile]|uniref:adrenodoxin-like protein 2, mitochondrial isoform X2 n=1 Tax=Linepithema humile TaxID=83485 RepID=UPI000623650C|nr:PREDICTED: adrenodoxin isoform X2 [Linepithema humile]